MQPPSVYVNVNVRISLGFNLHARVNPMELHAALNTQISHKNNKQTRTHTWKHISLEDEEVKICTEERPHL